MAQASELGGKGLVHGDFEVCILEHDDRGVTTELEREFLQSGGGLFHEDLAHGGGAREGDLLHPWGLAQLEAESRGVGVGEHDVEHARREAGQLDQVGQSQRRQRGLGVRLDNHGAAGSEGSAGLSGDHCAGEVPGTDDAADTDGLPDGEGSVGGVGGLDGGSVDTGGLFCVPFKVGSGVLDLAEGLGQGFAVFPGDELSKVFLVLDHEVVQVTQPLGSLPWRGVFVGGKGRIGGVDGLVDDLDGLFWEGCNDLTGGRVCDLEGGWGLRDPLAVDIGSGPNKVLVSKDRGREGGHVDWRKKRWRRWRREERE